MSRTPPTGVRRQLRYEVGFGCPVPGCGNPYLSYHHFDPPWSVEQHHNPDGMIALCGEHHPKADAGAFTAEQLRSYKHRHADIVQGSFDWRRQSLLALVGGNLYFETPKIVVVRGDPVVWFERDADGCMLLSARMLSRSDEPRAFLEANDWMLLGSPIEFESPPNGKRIKIRYGNGDALRVEFSSLKDITQASTKYSLISGQTSSMLPFPLTLVELQMEVGGTGILFGPTSTTIGGITMTGCLTRNCQTGLVIS